MAKNKFLKDLKTEDHVILVTFNSFDEYPKLIGGKFIIDNVSDSNMTFRDEHDADRIVSLTQFSTASKHETMINVFQYSGKPKGQYVGIFTDAETMIEEMQKIIRSNLEAEEKSKKS